MWYRRHRTLYGMRIHGEWQLSRKIIFFEFYSEIFCCLLITLPTVIDCYFIAVSYSVGKGSHLRLKNASSNYSVEPCFFFSAV